MAYESLVGPDTVAPKRTNIYTDADIVLPMYGRVKRIEYATDLHQDDHKNLCLVQKQYKRDHDRRVRQAAIFRVGDYIFLIGLLSCSWLPNIPLLKSIISYHSESKALVR